MRNSRAAILFVAIAVVLAVSHPLVARAQALDEGRAVREAFLLGFAYGNAHNVYSQNVNPSGQSQSVYDDWMADAVRFGRTLSVTVDVLPPATQQSAGARQAQVFRAGRRSADLLAVEISARHGMPPAAGLQLGYLSALAIEYVPFLDRATQQEDVATYESLASRMKLPASVSQEFVATLTRTTDRKQLVAAMFSFKNAVVRHYESIELRTVSGVRRQLSVWRMGWTLGLATLGQTHGADPDTVSRMFQESRSLGTVLGVRVPALPEALTKSARDTASALHYLLNDAGEGIGAELSSHFGPHASGMFELAIKSSIATILYAPDDDLGQSLAGAIDRSGAAAALPLQIYQPLVLKMRSRRPYSEVKQEIGELNNRIVAYLEAAAK